MHTYNERDTATQRCRSMRTAHERAKVLGTLLRTTESIATTHNLCNLKVRVVAWRSLQPSRDKLDSAACGDVRDSVGKTSFFNVLAVGFPY